MEGEREWESEGKMERWKEREGQRETVIERGEQTKWQSPRSGCIKSIHKKRTKMSVWKHLSGGVIHSDTAQLPQWVNSCNHSSAADINSLSQVEVLCITSWITVIQNIYLVFLVFHSQWKVFSFLLFAFSDKWLKLKCHIKLQQIFIL